MKYIKTALYVGTAWTLGVVGLLLLLQCDGRAQSMQISADSKGTFITLQPVENSSTLDQYDKNGLTTMEVSWFTTKAKKVSIVVGPDTEGIFRTFGVSKSSGTATTKNWVRRGMNFYLFNADTGELLTSVQAE